MILTADEKEALKITLLFRLDLLRKIEAETSSSDILSEAREQISNLVSAAQKLELP